MNAAASEALGWFDYFSNLIRGGGHGCEDGLALVSRCVDYAMAAPADERDDRVNHLVDGAHSVGWHNFDEAVAAGDLVATARKSVAEKYEAFTQGASA